MIKAISLHKIMANLSSSRSNTIQTTYLGGQSRRHSKSLAQCEMLGSEATCSAAGAKLCMYDNGSLTTSASEFVSALMTTSTTQTCFFG